MGKHISKADEPEGKFSENLIKVFNSISQFNLIAKGLLNLEKTQSSVNLESKFQKFEKRSTSVNSILKSNQSIQFSLEFLTFFISEILFKYNISSYNSLIPQQTDYFDSEAGKWAFEVIHSKENEELLYQFEKILPKFKENELINNFDDCSSIHENSDIKDDEISQFSEHISENKSNNMEVSAKKRVGSNYSWKKSKLRREGIKSPNILIKGIQKMKANRVNSTLSSISPNGKFSKSRDITSDDSDKNQNKSKKVKYDLNYNKITEMHEEELKNADTLKKINSKPEFSTPLRLVNNKERVKSLNTIKSIKSMKEIKKLKMTPNIISRNKKFLRKEHTHTFKKKGKTSLKLQISLDKKQQNNSPSHLKKLNKEQLNKYIIQKSKFLSSDKKCKKHKNLRTKKVIEEENLMMSQKNYIRIDLRVLEEELKDSDPGNIFKIEKMRIDGELNDNIKKPPAYKNNSDKTNVPHSLSSLTTNKFSLTKEGLEMRKNYKGMKSSTSENNMNINKDKKLLSKYNK